MYLEYTDEHEGYVTFFTSYEEEGSAEIVNTERYIFKEDDNLNGKIYDSHDNTELNISYHIEYGYDYQGEGRFNININYYGTEYSLLESDWVYTHVG